MKEQIKQYIVVSPSTIEDGYTFLEEVNRRIAQGYVPLGGMVIRSKLSSDEWYQTMVLKGVVK